MKNREKYRDEIFNTPRHAICDSFIRPIILKKYGTICRRIGCLKCSLIRDIWLNDEYNISETNWSEIKENTKIYVGDTEEEVEEKKNPRHFAKYEDGIVYAYTLGHTRSEYNITSWKYAKLAEDDVCTE